MTPSFTAIVADERRLDRRGFLAALGSATVLAAAGRWLASRRAARDAAAPAIAHADVTGLAPGDARVIATATGDALVVRRRDGRVAAFDRRCPHLGCPVVWAAGRDRIECPCHGAAFDAGTGVVLFGPPRRGLTLLTITDG